MQLESQAATHREVLFHCLAQRTHAHVLGHGVHVSCQRMAKLMRPSVRRINARPLHATSHRGRDRLFRLEAPNRRVHAQKHSTAFTTWTSALEVGSNRLANRLEQRQWRLL